MEAPIQQWGTSIDDASARLLETVEARLDELADACAASIFFEIPAYSAEADADLHAAVRSHVLAHYRAIAGSFRQQRSITREDLVFMRGPARARVGRVSVTDFVHAFPIGERVLLDAVLELGNDDRSRQAVLRLVNHMISYFAVATLHAAEVYMEAEQEAAGEAGERVRRDLLERLLEGRALAPGLQLDAALAAGLEPGARCLVVAALPTARVEDEHALRAAATALARASQMPVQPLTIVRRDEIVLVLPVPTGGAEGLAARLEDAQRRLLATGLPLALGVSTVADGTASVPQAYAQAAAARERLAQSPGTIALCAMTAFEYLTWRGDSAARDLIRPEIERFVAADLRDGGVLIETLRAYFGSDLNTKRTAELLHVHVNTAHYRLAKIAERTGCDLRHLDDVIELLIASRLSRAQ